MAKSRSIDKKSLLNRFLKKESQKTKSMYAGVIKANEYPDLEFIKTGVREFDAEFGGLARGRTTMIYGGPSAGKSTLLLRILGNLQKQGLSVFLAESEETFEKQWASKQGLNLDELPIDPRTGLGEVLDSVGELIGKNYLDVVVVDSLAGLKPKEYDKKGTEDDFMALTARRLDTWFKKYNELIAKSQTAVIFTSQKRDTMNMYESIEHYPGGNALKHFLSLAVNMRRSGKGSIPDKGARFDEDHTGFPVTFKVAKSKLPNVLENSKFTATFMHGKGFDSYYSICDLALENEVIVKESAGVYQFTYSNGESYKVRGINKLIADLREDEELFNNVVEETTKAIQRKLSETPEEKTKRANEEIQKATEKENEEIAIEKPTDETGEKNDSDSKK